jgi:hypothetical protein
VPRQGYRRRSEGDTLFPALLAGSPAGVIGRHPQRPVGTGVDGISFTVHPLAAEGRPIRILRSSLSDRHLLPTLCVSALLSSAALLRRRRPSRRPSFGPPQRYSEYTPCQPPFGRPLARAPGAPPSCLHIPRVTARTEPAVLGAAGGGGGVEVMAVPASRPRSPALGSPAGGAGRHSQRPGVDGYFIYRLPRVT